MYIYIYISLYILYARNWYFAEITLFALSLLSTLFLLTLAMRELCHWSSIPGMLPQRGTVVIRRMGALNCLHEWNKMEIK